MPNCTPLQRPTTPTHTALLLFAGPQGIKRKTLRAGVFDRHRSLCRGVGGVLVGREVEDLSDADSFALVTQREAAQLRADVELLDADHLVSKTMHGE